MALKHKTASTFAVASLNAIPSMSMLDNRYGHFNPENSEFVITDVLTPRPWVNVLANDRYGVVLSQIGGGFSWAENCQLQRLTRWEQDLAADAYGRWLYIYETESQRLLSTTFAPLRERAQKDEVRHGLGYTQYLRDFEGLQTRQIVFVPLEEACEHWIIEIANTLDVSKALRLGSYMELHLGNQAEWHREFHRLFVSLEEADDSLFAWKRNGLEEGSRDPSNTELAAYVTVAGLEKVSWHTDKARWLGKEGRIEWPAALVKDVSPANTGRWDDPIAAFVSDVVIPAGGSLRFGLTLGVESHLELARAAAKVSLREIENRLEKTKRYFQKRCGALHVETADKAFDLLNNAWLPYQAEVGRMKARCAYYQQGGAYGFRDQLQDSLCLLETDPQATLIQLELHAEAMYEDGGVRHWWHPDSPHFVESKHSDTCLWLAYGVLEYLDETANLASLNRPLRYLSRQTQEFASEGSLLDHCVRGIARFLERRSHRGMPLIGSGDWNDGLSHAGIEGKGESVWLAMFGFDILNRMAEVLERLGDSERARCLRAESAALQTAVEAYGWDGEWYIAGFSDDGRPFGSKENIEGKIFLNPQTWAIITGIASNERAQMALESVRKHLLKPYGALLLGPAYQDVDPYIGYITRYAPGLRENGGVYSHASTWAIQAFAQAGDIETAYELYRGMMPALRAVADSERYQAEPYVMPGNVDGPDSPYEGRAGWTWYTGSAAWMRRVAVRWLLGVRPGFEGLTVEPKLPRGLGPANLRRPFRGKVFEIELDEDLPGGKRVNPTSPP